MLRSARVHVSGIVQGVGFRPFVYKLATSLNLTGYVINLGDAGVEIFIEGEEEKIKSFLNLLHDQKPPTSYIEDVIVQWFPYKGRFSTFSIRRSSKIAKGEMSIIPPDVGICDECVRDILNPSSRYYLYPFTNCSVCGPRFTVICDLPYDRDRTSMVDFPLCNDCLKEYQDPNDRRYHAQGICCPNCGPKIFLYSIDGELVNTPDPIFEAAKLLREGFIIGVKGLGGFHIASKTTDDDVVLKLRRRRKRPSQPFAVMSPNIDTVKTFAVISPIEEKLLTSYIRPIILLQKSDNYFLSKWISPGLHTIGVMLPYTGIHLLLLSFSREPALIMTSGNLPGEPMVISNSEAFKKLENIVDYLLIHNRRIINRCDDSVLRVTSKLPVMIRRSRGYVPVPVKLPLGNKLNILAMGGEEFVTGALLKENKCYITQHIGDTDRLTTLTFLESALNFIIKITRTSEIHYVSCDLHPMFSSRRLAAKYCKKFSAELIPVQHHIGHFASLMADSKIPVNEPSVCIVIDGYGYGLDGQAWGGEILAYKNKKFFRVGHLEYVPLLGGDLATKYPAYILAGMLTKVYSKDFVFNFLTKNVIAGFKHGEKGILLALEQLERKFNITYTSSMGRILDAFSALFGICYHRTYEGEPAMKFESFAWKAHNKSPLDITVPIKWENGEYLILTTELLKQIIELMNSKKYSLELLAKSVHIALGKSLAEVATKVAERLNASNIGVSGGAAVNEFLVSSIKKIVEERGFNLIRHVTVPPGDGGLSLGQCYYSLLNVM